MNAAVKKMVKAVSYQMLENLRVALVWSISVKSGAEYVAAVNATVNALENLKKFY